MNTRLPFVLILLALNHFGYAQASSTEIQGNLRVADNPETSEVEGKLEVGYGISVGGGVLGGPNSLAIGLGATAFGDLSVAMGSMVDGRVERTRAYGQYSVAFGFGAIAGDSADPAKTYNLAFGAGSAALEDGSIAIGKFASSTGGGAYAFGFKAQASGSSSFALGYETQANGYLCYAFGPGCIAELNNTLALGHFSEALGVSDVVIGFDCIADAAHQRSYLFGNSLRSSANNQVIVGLFNDPSDAQQVGNQNVTPAFVVANGTSDEDRSNALVIYKNGDGVIKGTLRTTKPSSAIPMGIFGAPENASAQ